MNWNLFDWSKPETHPPINAQVIWWFGYRADFSIQWRAGHMRSPDTIWLGDNGIYGSAHPDSQRYQTPTHWAYITPPEATNV